MAMARPMSPLRVRSPARKNVYSTRFAFLDVTKENPELERISAYASIDQMQQQMKDFGEEADTKQAITELALEHGLVTDYTSMVVVRNEVFEARGISVSTSNASRSRSRPGR
jgi:Ca-activated chloride channel family protein